MKNILVSMIMAILVAGVTVTLMEKRAAPSQAQQEQEDPFFRRVESSGEVRCGYVSNPPFVNVDPNTHALSGIFVDITAKIAQITGWKIVWSSETSYPTMAQDMAQGKFDVFCGGSWPIALSEKGMWWAGPLFYSGVAAFARADDERFGPGFDLKTLDDPAYSISVLDGVAVDLVRAMDFPRASVVSLPNSSSYGDMILQVVSHKADVVFIEQETAYLYMDKNPGKIKRIGGNQPLRFYGMGYEFPYKAPRLRNVFETAMRELVDSNAIDRILKPYETQPDTFYRVRLITAGNAP